MTNALSSAFNKYPTNDVLMRNLKLSFFYLYDMKAFNII